MAGRTSEGTRTTLVLTRRYLADVVHNPALLVSCLVPLGLTVMLWFLGQGSIEAPEERQLFSTAMFSYAVLFEVIMVTTMIVVYAMAEEREKHTLRTFLLAGVRQSQIVLAHGLAASFIVAGVAALSALAVGAAALNAVLVAPVALVGALPLTIVSLAVGLVTRNQMNAMTLDTPFIIVGVLPLFTMVNEGMAALTPLLPTGGLYILTQLALQGMLFTPTAVLPAVSILVWTALSVVALALVIKRAPQEA
ncbi:MULTISPECIES: hypothetical protein [Gordonibacter]|uniref:ABC transporter permease n=1 Tax=Gordonibacter faecis TaxID=3047475 RepID=A0ABT7DNZ0_9ACTN|nr:MULTISPECIES: hypothetical protein [unclassified Gordonibacter]MDJ1651255.1 hypothetical protein [Gordonibacter sp. KGMB12511]HIW76188.1 ABC transporter permease [Candidatus Gordonibacter avicola]